MLWTGLGDDSYVLVCTCRDLAEAQLARAALEAREVPVRIDGIATQGVLGMIHGAVVAPRVMVPRPWRGVAREIVAEIVGPFADDGPDDVAPGEREDTPFRAAAADDEEAGDSSHDDALDVDGGAALDEPDDGPAAPKKRSLAVPLMLGMLAMAWGFGHIYARKPVIGGVLMATALVSAVLYFSGVYAAGGVLVAVAIVDVLGAMFFVARANRTRAG